MLIKTPILAHFTTHDCYSNSCKTGPCPSGVLAEGPGAVLPPVKIFRGRQKLEKSAKNCITNDSRTPFVGRNSEFGKTEELFNSLGRLCFAEVSGQDGKSALTACHFLYGCI